MAWALVALWEVTFTLRVRGEAGNTQGSEQGGGGGRDAQEQNWAEHLTRSVPSSHNLPSSSRHKTVDQRLLGQSPPVKSGCSKL